MKIYLLGCAAQKAISSKLSFSKFPVVYDAISLQSQIFRGGY
jgi:hypothetical protein